MKRYSELDPRKELEQQVAHDLDLALRKRGATVTHHGSGASHAPSTAPADITLDWGSGKKGRRILVEVAQRRDETEFTSIVSHLDAAVVTHDANVLYAGRATSARMIRFIRNENQRRRDNKLRGRIVFLRLDDLQEVLEHWRSHPDTIYPVEALLSAYDRWEEFLDDLNAYRAFQEVLFPSWKDKADEIRQDIAANHVVRQERLRRDIINLENKLREGGITGQRAQKMLIYLFFLALHEDKRGAASRLTPEGFAAYKRAMPTADRTDLKLGFVDRTIHHLIVKEIMQDPEIKASGMMSQYEKIDLTDSFVASTVLPIFEGYAFARSGMDIIGAIFESLARRAEKDNRIGQFFTPENAVIATCRFAGLLPTDLVADPACGTARFLIHAMIMMLAQAGSVSGVSRADAEKNIRRSQLLGVDLDPWIATIGKMNMYIHGDGKSNVRDGNGLALSITDVFAPERTGTLTEKLDVVLTNPPLGDLNFREVGLSLARRGLLSRGVPPDSEDKAEELAAAWSRERLAVVPHVCNEEVQAEAYRKKIEEWRERERTALQAGDSKAAARAKRHGDQFQDKLGEVQKKIGAKDLTWSPAGKTAKGGALFLSAIKDYLKPTRIPGAPEEWKGGALGIILDEAILNTVEYRIAREFIRRHFFVKAVISLPRDAFAYIAKTTAKTSIVYLVRKGDPDVVQREPIFYAGAESIGFTVTGKPCDNDLERINADFDNWRKMVLSCYAAPGSPLNERKLAADMKACDGLGTRFFAYSLDAKKTSDRLDLAYWRMIDEIKAMKGTVLLQDLVENVTRKPKEHPTYRFAMVSRQDGRVRVKQEDVSTSYAAADLRIMQAGDILLSGIDVVHGALGVVGKDCDGMIVSKEYYTLRVKEEHRKRCLPEFVAAVLRSPRMQTIIEGIVSGTSCRTRIENIDSFLNIPIPALPAVTQQRKYARKVRMICDLQDRCQHVITEIQDDISKALWKP